MPEQVSKTHSDDLFLQHEPRFFFPPSARLKEEVCLSTSSHGDFRRYFFFLFHLVSELKGSC